MENNNSLEEQTNKFINELHDEVKFYKRVGLGAMLFGAAMVMPMICAQKFGYDFKTPFNAYEWFACVSAFASVIPMSLGAVNYGLGCMGEYILNEDE